MFFYRFLGVESHWNTAVTCWTEKQLISLADHQGDVAVSSTRGAVGAHEQGGYQTCLAEAAINWVKHNMETTDFLPQHQNA